MLSVLRKRGIAATLTAVLAVGATLGLVTSASAIDANNQNLQFTNTVKIGQDALLGFSSRYADVFTGVDALVTVTQITPSTPTLVSKISNLDRVSTVNNWQMWTNLQIASGGGQVTYRVEFVASGTRNPVTLENFKVNVGDIDARQYVQFTGPTSYTLASSTQLAVLKNADNAAVPVGAFRFAEPSGTGSTDDDTRFWAQVNYAKASFVDVTLGAAIGGAALYQVSFGAAPWGNTQLNTVTQPVQNPPQVKVIYDANGGTGTPPTSAPANLGSEFVIAPTPEQFPPPAGYSGFVQWNTRQDGSGAAYNPNGTITPTVETTLYAIWLQQVTLTYNANGGAGNAPAAQTVSSGVSTAISGNSGLTLAGSQFVGWNTLADGTGVTFLPGATLNVAANTTLYALWDPIPVVPPDAPINIDLEPGEPIGGAEVDYVIPAQPYDPNCNPDEPGDAWSITVTSLEPAGSTTEIDAGCTPANGDIFGTAVLPQDMPEGIYQVVYESTNGETIVRYFEVNEDGTFGGQSNTKIIRELAKTGASPLSGLVLPGILLIIVLGGVATFIAHRNRARRNTQRSSLAAETDESAATSSV